MPAEHSNSGKNRNERVFSQTDRMVIERASVSEAARAAVVECAEEARLDGDQKAADRLMVLVGEADRILKRRGHTTGLRRRRRLGRARRRAHIAWSRRRWVQ